MKSFAVYHMQYLLQSLCFEKMCEGSYKDTTSLMEWHIKQNLDIFRSDQLTTNQKSPNKMIYDSVRIVGLKMATAINKSLIYLHAAPED